MEEIELLERVLMRLGCADTDEKLETSVGKFLAPVILKIESPNETVRSKVIEVLTHLNKRLKSRSEVKIPVETLLHQFKESKSPFLHNFSIIYVIMGYPRLPIDKQMELIPLLLSSLEGKPEVHQDKLLTLILPVLGEMKIPDDNEKRNAVLGLENKQATKKQLVTLLQDILLLPYGVTQDAELPPGLSQYSFKRIIVNNWKAEELEQIKKGIVRFVCNGVFSNVETFILLVLASSDTRFSVATPAIAELSKICTALEFSDPKVTAPLYVLFNGNNLKNADRKTTPCSARVRQKLLQYLIRCRGKAINTVQGIQVIFESLFGENTNQKCKVLALQFSENLVKEGPRDVVSKVSKILLGGLQKLVGRETNQPNDVQNAAYNAMAQLTRIFPEIINQDLKIVVSYFNHLSSAPVELQTSIRDTLVAMAPAFSWQENNAIMEIDDDSTKPGHGKKFQMTPQHQLLLAMLSDNAESKLQIIQNVTSVFLTTCFPEYFAPSRYLLLLIAGESSALHESITSSLYGVSKRDQTNYSMLSSIDWPEESIDDFNKLHSEQRRVILPSFKEMINYVTEMNIKRMQSTSVQKISVGRKTLAFSIKAYEEILNYLRTCLWFSAGNKCEPGDTNSKNVKKLREFIIENYENNKNNEFYKYLELVKTSVEAKRDITNLLCLFDLLNAAPQLMASNQMDLTEPLSFSLRDVSEVIRLNASQVYGILLAYGLSESDFSKKLTEMIDSLPQRTLENRHGWILVIGQSLFYKISSMTEEKKKQTDFNKWKEFTSAIELFVKMLFETQPLLISAAIKGISLIGKLIKIPNFEIVMPKDKLKINEEQINWNGNELEVTSTTKHIIFEIIFYYLKNSGSKPKIKEDAAKCLGHLGIGDGEFFTKQCLEKFLLLIKMQKDVALNIEISNAICCCLNGFDINSEAPSNGYENLYCDNKTFDWFLCSIIRSIGDPNPHSRQCCALWLLAITKRCSYRPNLLAKKQMLQLAFTELLSDDSEFVQDVASRGLGLVYQLSDANSQNDLANLLVGQLIGGKRQVRQVNMETEVFPEGFLGKTPSGGNITTYKELCGLASDLNQPEMIYQFMQLANHNANWSSKLGAAFGFKSITKDAKAVMSSHLGKIVPRLYRYKYDPTPKIQNSMLSIWDSIVSDSKGTIELYYWDIMKEILTNLTVNEWRVRIACCLAVRDLLKRPNGLKLRTDEKKQNAEDAMDVDNEVPEPELKELWSQLFRVMDDIHEGTRMAAEGTSNYLSKICVVAASDSHGKSGAFAVCSSILPLLMDVGITHTVPEVRKISIKTISELIDSSGSLIKPHLAILIPCLLRATGELETKKLAYLSTRLGADNEAQEVVDSIRAEAAKSNLTMETISKCSRQIDYNELEKMTPAIIEITKSTVCLGTKIASAHFLCLISIRLGNEMQPLVGKYLSICFSGLKDRNGVVRKYYASAIGHLIGLAKEQSVKKLLQKLDEYYTENSANKGIPLALQSINKRHHDLLKDYWENILPLIFFAMHEEQTEENKDNIELWKELWIEIAPGDAGIRMNLDSIIPKLKTYLDDPSWLKKTQSANSIGTLGTKLGTQLDHENRIKLIELLLSGLQGRTFQGKERLIQALASLCKCLPKDDEIVERIIESVMRECRKEEAIYRTKVLKSLGDILEELEADHFEEVYQMIWHILDKKSLHENTDDDEDMITSEEKNKRAQTLNQLKEAICETLGKSWPKNSVETQQKFQLQLAERCTQCLRNNTRQVQVSLLVALEKFLERLKIFDQKEENESIQKKIKVNQDRDEIIDSILSSILNALNYIAGLPHTGLKKESLSIYLILIKKLKGKENLHHLSIVKKSFDENLTMFRKDHAPEVRCRIKDIEENLKKIFNTE